MATTTMRPAHQPTAMSSLDRLQEALRDLDEARQSATGELRTQLDLSMDLLRSAVSDLRGRAEESAQEFQGSLDRASEHLRVELGLRAIRAQTTIEALTKLSSEIRRRKAELTT